MKTFRADLHVHSRFSRATSGRLNVRNLAAWSLIKGLSIMSTGDFTHPAWREELRRDLVFDDNTGLYRVREQVPVEEEIPGFVRPADTPDPLFLIEAEISSIYKKDGAVRKVHNLVYMPTLESADALSTKLAAIGNITSDGRPILGLDSENLLEMVLETDERGVLIPAHIWTPWFSLFGSKSGFDTLEDCFGSLSSHIFALETGLSSDPDMNRLWSALDRYALVSNSDAHSGENLGREANLFSGQPSYDGLFEALRRTARGEAAATDADCVFHGTVEFFPEEGKYHLDGHRACNVVLEPGESMKLGNICPVCGKTLTVGVLHRVMALADRQTPVMPANDPGFVSLFPLPEMLGELLGVGPKSRKVQARQAELVRLFGSELDILHNVPESDLRQHWDALGEAVARMRRGDVIREGGYDGEYGVVRVFPEEERKAFVSGRYRSASLFAAGSGKESSLLDLTSPTPQKDAPAVRVRRKKQEESSLLAAFAHAAEQSSFSHAAGGKLSPETVSGSSSADPTSFPYSEAQLRAIDAGPHPVLVLAGPGAGKTRTLVGRIQRLRHEGVPAERILAVTFTRRAAAELKERLEQALPDGKLPDADTLHALALAQWSGEQPVVLSEEAARGCFTKANPDADKTFLRRAWAALSLARERLEAWTRGQAENTELALSLQRYRAYKTERGLADYTDLLEHWLRQLVSGEARPLWSDVLVDEIQDFSPLQIALVHALLPAGRTSGAADGSGFFGIGDPDQAIYGFRGATPDIRAALTSFWPNMETVTLSASHRSAAGILLSASSLLGPRAACGQLTPTRTTNASLHLFNAPDGKKEAAWIADQIANLLGGTSHTLEDARSRTRKAELDTPCSPGEIAVLVRMKALIPPLRAALDRRGIPCSVPEAAPFWEDPATALLLALAGAHFGIPLPFPEAPMPPVLPDSLTAALWEKGPSALLKGDPVPPFDALFRESAAFIGLTRAYREHKNWPDLLQWVRLRQDLDLVREQAEQVQIMTLHASKGLEFRAVFLPALEAGLLPFSGMDALLHTGADSDENRLPAADLAEERRLLYVGITRAQDAVFASHADQRQLYGHMLRLSPSPFLADLPDLFQRSRLIRHTQKIAKQISLF